MSDTIERPKVTLRLDRLLVEQRFFPSREKAAYAIRAGGVHVNGHTVTKPAASVDSEAQITVNPQSTLRIGRGEHKLAGVLESFQIDCLGKIALDVGSGAGGFTWQLLRQGAKRVYAVDVGTNQLHSDLRSDPRVAVFEQTDIRDLTKLPKPPHIAVVDVSFISLRLVLPHVCALTRADADLVVLLKPQFEAATSGLEKGGSIHERDKRRRICDAFVAWCSATDLTVKGESETHYPVSMAIASCFFISNAPSGATSFLRA
ncbi:MAG: TlyA family RNA methyltransferase [Chloroflexota bacterium]|nr:TlyA family RNA methyltransferase [Chloroflexota bacterium]